jgi:hypothetical protein
MTMTEKMYGTETAVVAAGRKRKLDLFILSRYQNTCLEILTAMVPAIRRFEQDIKTILFLISVPILIIFVDRSAGFKPRFL